MDARASISIGSFMKNIEKLFEEAYGLYVADNNYHAAAEMCRVILNMNPNHHNARLLLGIILADHGNLEEKQESSKHFIEAIKRAEKIKDIFTNKWDEEDPIYQLAVSQYRENKLYNAALLLLIDYVYSEEDHASELLCEVLDKLDPDINVILKIILLRIKKESK